MCECRLLVLLVAGALVTTACTSAGSKAPVVERSTPAVAGGQYAESSRSLPATADWQASETDWTATVRPLGDSEPTATRVLSGEESAAPATDAAAPESASAPRKLAASSTARSPASTAANPAVVSLLNTARAQSKGGDHTRAAATLERAIAIEPNNAWLWHRLADTRLREGRLEQAAGLAAKSSALATEDRSLQADNWKLIAEVRRRQGDAAAAAAAESQAGALAN